MIGNLSKEVDFQRWCAAVVTAGTDVGIVESAAIDCAGYDRIMVTLDIGATAAQNGTVKFYLEECASSAGVYAALTGATIGTHTHTGSGETAKTYIIDAKLNLRYIKVVYQRETQNTIFNSGIALLYNNKKLPIAQNAVVKELIVV
jgi:hypothetical protein